MKTKIDDNTTLDCGHKPSPHPAFTTGYGMDASGKTCCWTCCGERDKQAMQANGRIDLYLTRNDQGQWEVSNWPGTLRFKAMVSTGSHNIARIRRDAWFVGPNNTQWHGVSYGDNTEVIRCRQVKKP